MLRRIAKRLPARATETLGVPKENAYQLRRAGRAAARAFLGTLNVVVAPIIRGRVVDSRA